MTRRKCCTTGGCPFACSEESEIAQNYGCLPTGADIISMRLNHNKTWACHSFPNKPCLGAQLRLKELGLEYKVVDNVLVTEKDDWGIYSDSSEEFTKLLTQLDMNTISNTKVHKDFNLLNTGLSILELSELVKAFEDKFDVKALGSSTS